jgi:hypothetical protein
MVKKGKIHVHGKSISDIYEVNSEYSEDKMWRNLRLLWYLLESISKSPA